MATPFNFRDPRTGSQNRIQGQACLVILGCKEGSLAGVQECRH